MWNYGKFDDKLWGYFNFQEKPFNELFNMESDRMFVLRILNYVSSHFSVILDGKLQEIP